MTAATRLRMTADEFIAWARGQPRRHELVAGEAIAMSPERLDHIRIKSSAWLRLREAVLASGLACEAVADGASVRIDDATVYEPDACVRCGDRLHGYGIEIADPVIVVEVVSPSSVAIDSGAKLDDYFRLPSVRHYLIVNGHTRSVIHHERTASGLIETRVVRSGPLALDPPGIVVEVEGFFEGVG